MVFGAVETGPGSGAARAQLPPDQLLDDLKQAVELAKVAFETGEGIPEAVQGVNEAQAALEQKFGIPPGGNQEPTGQDLIAGNVAGPRGAQLASGDVNRGRNAALESGNVLNPSGGSIVAGTSPGQRPDRGGGGSIVDAPRAARQVPVQTAGIPPDIVGRPAELPPAPFVGELAARGDIKADADADLAALAARDAELTGPGEIVFKDADFSSAPSEMDQLTPDSELLGSPRPDLRSVKISRVEDREDIVTDPVTPGDSITQRKRRSDISSVPAFGAGGSGPEVPLETRQAQFREFLASTGPVDVDLGNVSIQEQFASNAQGTLRKRIGLGEDFFTPERSGGFERFARGLISSAAIGKNVGEAPGSRFKDVTVQEILSDPLVAEEWSKLTDQEKAIVLFDSSDKAADALSLPQVEYERLLGSTSSEFQNKQQIITKTGGAVTSAFDRIPSPAAPSAAPVSSGVAPSTSAGGGAATGAASGGAPPPTGLPQKIGGRVGAGALGFSLGIDVSDLEEFRVTSDDFENPRGATVMMTNREARGHFNRGEIESVSDDDNEIGQFVLVDSIAADAEPVIVRRLNRAARADPAFFEDHARLEGGITNVLVGEGAEQRSMNVPEEFVILRPDLFGTERARGPIAAQDRQGRTLGVTEAEFLEAEPDELRKAPTRQEVTTKEATDRKVNLRASLTQTGELMDLNADVGVNGLGWLGAVAVFGAKSISGASFGTLDPLAEKWSRFFSGGDLSFVELDILRKQLRSWVSQRREILVGDKRLTNEDRKVLEGFIARGEAFASRESVEEMLEAFTRFEIITNELELEANNEALQFPVHNKLATRRTLLDLMAFGIPKENAKDILRGMKNYPELRGDE